jgi:hypothetical protein
LKFLAVRLRPACLMVLSVAILPDEHSISASAKGWKIVLGIHCREPSLAEQPVLPARVTELDENRA